MVVVLYNDRIWKGAYSGASVYCPKGLLRGEVPRLFDPPPPLVKETDGCAASLDRVLEQTDCDLSWRLRCLLLLGTWGKGLFTPRIGNYTLHR